MNLTESSIELLSSWLKDYTKKELCAFLLENKNGDQIIIRTFNISKYPGNFFITTSEIERIEQYAQSINSKVIAFIHSHWSHLDLSKSDHQSLRFSKYPWIVIHLKDTRLESRIYKSHYSIFGGSIEK